MYRLIKFEKSFAAHSTLYLFFQNNLFECCSMEQDWGQCHVNSTNVCFNEIQFTAWKLHSHHWYWAYLPFYSIDHSPVSDYRVCYDFWWMFVFLPCVPLTPLFPFVGSSVGGSVWGICPYACPGRPHRSLAAQLVLMSFLTASSRGRPSARRRPIRAAWVRFWQTQSSILHALATTTGAVSHRPCKGYFHWHLV